MDINTLKSKNFNPDTLEGEYNLVQMWVNPRAARIVAGILAGLFAAAVMVIFGMIYCGLKGFDLTAPMRIAALPFLGRSALEFGNSKGIVVGLLAHGALSAFSGAVYAHFTGVNHLKALWGMGVTWAAFSWVFITNLFLPSCQAYREAQIPSGVMFFAWIVFGLSLSSVAMFDRKNPNK